MCGAGWGVGCEGRCQKCERWGILSGVMHVSV